MNKLDSWIDEEGAEHIHRVVDAAVVDDDQLPVPIGLP
jgi:hypothetical protein